jgi:hypothetical protein
MFAVCSCCKEAHADDHAKLLEDFKALLREQKASVSLGGCGWVQGLRA